MTKLLIKSIIAVSCLFLLSGCSSKEPNHYFKVAGKKHGINYKTVRAIAEVESNNTDNIINVNYQHIFKGSHRFDNSFTANLYMDTILDPTFANYDIGVCQVNKLWLDKFGLDNEDLLDRETNIDKATWIYADNVRVCKGDIKCALSRYNTGRKKSKIGYRYANKVLKARKRLFGK